MPRLDLTTVQSDLNEWLAADLTVAKGQAYSIARRSLSKADATTIRQNIEYCLYQEEGVRATLSEMSYNKC